MIFDKSLYLTGCDSLSVNVCIAHTEHTSYRVVGTNKMLNWTAQL